MRKCAIIAGGDMTEKGVAVFKAHRREYEYIICADSGYRHAEKLGIVPDLIAGDFDSYTDGLPEGVEIMASIPEKDDTDTIMAVKKAMEMGYTQISLYGALGGSRFEHTIANIQTMIYAFQQGCNLCIFDESILMIQGADDGDVIYKHPEGKELFMSVFALTESVGIERLSGVKYPLENYRMMQSFPIGVSNEITDSAARLRIKDGLALIVLTEK